MQIVLLRQVQQAIKMTDRQTSIQQPSRWMTLSVQGRNKHIKNIIVNIAKTL